MSNPVVWDDASGRLKAACAALNILVTDPNSPPPDKGSVNLWVSYELVTSRYDRLELNDMYWQEVGNFWYYVFSKRNTGSRDAIVARHKIALAFRAPQPLPLAQGLLYGSMAFDAGSADDKGDWMRFPALVDYEFQDFTGVVS